MRRRFYLFLTFTYWDFAEPPFILQILKIHKTAPICVVVWRKLGKCNDWTSLHYGIRADILKKSYQKMFNFENWFLCQFSSNTWFFFGGGSLNTPKIGKRKKEFTNINLRGFKTKKNVKGVFFTDETGLKIFVFLNAMIFAFITCVTNTPLWAKNASKV